LTAYIENGFQQQSKTGTVFLDLTAAYDTVWHTGLLYKLNTGSLDWLNYCYEIGASGCTWVMTPAPGDHNKMASHKVPYQP